jgi:dihydrofolate reductase
MKGGTTFHFVTDGVEAALEAAKGQDVRLAGGAATVQQYLRAGLVGEMHVAIAPILLGGGEDLTMILLTQHEFSSARGDPIHQDFSG